MTEGSGCGSQRVRGGAQEHYHGTRPPGTLRPVFGPQGGYGSEIESYAAARRASASATLIALFTTPDPGRPDAAIVLSRSRCVISDRGFWISGSAAQAARRTASEASHIDGLGMNIRRAKAVEATAYLTRRKSSKV